jgi:predicted dienelactone hydrolase
MKRFLVLTLSALVLASCASKSDKTDPNAVPVIKNPYSLENTTIPVGVIPAATLHDAQRNRDVEFSIEYPTRGGPYPIVIFSPEYGGSRASYVGLSAFWAGRGYVVIKTSHADAGATRAAVEQRLAERQAQMGNQQDRGRGGRNQRPPDNGSFQNLPFRSDPSTAWETEQTQADWAARAADVRLILTSLPKVIEQYPEIKDRADATRVGIGGHAYGALTALMTAGVMGTPDPRVKAVEAMSPPGALPDRGLTTQSLANVHVPTLFLTGSRDFGAVQTEDLTWRKQAFDVSAPGDKWFVSIQGAGRSAFTGTVGDLSGYGGNQPIDMPYPTNRPGSGGMYPQQQPMPNNNRAPVIMGGASTGTVRTISLAFWDAYLKSDNAGREYLDKLKGRGDVQVETK